MKLVYLIFVMISLTSCFTQSNITKSNEPISETILKKMKPGKVYHFHFKDEYIYKVKIENTDSIVTGKTKSVYHEHIWRGEVPAMDKFMDTEEKEPFVYSYSEIQEKTSKITTRKINPILTTLGVGSLIAIGIGLAEMDIDTWNP